MRKVSPSSRHAQDLLELIERGRYTSGSDFEIGGFLGDLLRKSIQRIVTEALEQERTDHLGRDRYERDNSAPSGYRNGYREGQLRTAEGSIPIEIPKVRGTDTPFNSKLWPLLAQRTPALENLAVEAYAMGLSTRDVESLFTTDAGQRLLSKSAVSDLSDRLWEEYEAFCERDLSGYRVDTLFLDAAYESMRKSLGNKESILAAWAILDDGRRVLIHLAQGYKESYDSWLTFLRDLVGRGMGLPVFVQSDGAPGLIRAIEDVFPTSLRGRCVVHKKRNVLARVPKQDLANVREWLNSVYLAATHEAGQKNAEAFIREYESLYPQAVKVFRNDLDASLNHLRMPAAQRKAVRTTNLIERGFGEQKRRTKVIPRFFTEKSCLKLAFTSLLRASDNWKRVTMTDVEREEIKQLRKQLNQPDPTNNRAKGAA
jgi:transposase-like protein